MGEKPDGGFAMVSQRSGWVLVFALLTLVGAASILGARQVAQTATKSVSGRITMDGGGTPARFTLPLQNPGRPAASVAINPQPDGTFRVTLPIGMSIVGTPSGGFAVKSFTYGGTDLLTSPLVVAAADTAELLITLRAPTSVSVSGRVVGLPFTSGILLVLMGTPLETLVRPDGSFTFNNVTPGNYQLRVISPLIMQQVVPLTVGSTNLTDVTISMPQERWVTGRVVIEGSNAPPPGVSAEARSADGRILSATTPSAYEGTNTGQFFVFRLRSGEYTISLRSIPAGYQLKSLSYGTVDLLKQPLKVDGTAGWDIVARLVPDRR
jgi:hypothetical protein